MSGPRTPLVGLILAGGRGSRMGSPTPKPLLEIGGRSMVARVAARLEPFVDRLLIATDRPDLYTGLGAGLLADRAPGHAGPLAGLQAGALHILQSGEPAIRMVSAPGDTPFLPDDFIPRMLDGAAPDDFRVASFAGRPHPVCAVWPVSALHRLAVLELDAANAPSLGRAMREHDAVPVPFPASQDAPGGDPFFNVNTPAELEAARRFALSRG